jgi:hypothetical protein
MPATGVPETSGLPSPVAQSAEERLHLESQILAQVRDAAERTATRG